MSILKPCPFCGGEASLYKADEIVGHGMMTTLHFVECDTCKSRGTTIDTYLDGWRGVEEKAINAWNRRVELPESPRTDE